ncbi:35363_t:CDS:2, partial [Gigaspora margarita]
MLKTNGNQNMDIKRMENQNANNKRMEKKKSYTVSFHQETGISRDLASLARFLEILVEPHVRTIPYHMTKEFQD